MSLQRLNRTPGRMNRLVLRCSILALASVSAGAHAQVADGSVLPRPEAPFVGKIGQTMEETAPQQYPSAPRAPKGAPNIMVVLIDDSGFGQTSSFGGAIPTPNLERLAAQGLRYNNFHVNPICSPTRASLLTGRNSHAVGFGLTIESETGYPGYNMVLPKRAATVAEILRQNGYSTAMFGKHHNTPRWLATPAGPFDTWPTGLGFEYFYGFNGGDMDQYRPVLFRGTNRVPTPNDPSYMLDNDLANDAIDWVHRQKGAAPDKPFFIYYAPGTNHAPHQAPSDWIARFKGKFDKGWDELRAETVARQKASGLIPKDAVVTPRPAAIPAWNTLTADQKKLYARMMEVYAATNAYEDEQIGQVFKELERMGELDNTLVMYITGDNGASASGGKQGTANEVGIIANNVPESEAYLLSIMNELGGPKYFNHHPAGWAWAVNAPFPLFKATASHLGGTTNGMVVSWPKRIKAHGEVRSQYGHVVDLLPTLLEVVGVPMPTSVDGVEQMPLDGVSLAYTLTPEGRKAPSRHKIQVYESSGTKAIYNDGWIANTAPKGRWADVKPGEPASGVEKWELHDLRTDYAQAIDLSAKYPDRLESMKQLWWQEAERNKILPIITRGVTERLDAATKAHGFDRPSSIYWGPLGLPEGAAPSLRSQSFTIKADLDIADAKKGVILATGNSFGGWSFYLDRDQVVAFNAFSEQKQHQYRIAAPLSKTGTVAIQFDFDRDPGGPTTGGLMRISIDGVEKASGRMERVAQVPQVAEEFNIGYDSGALVSPDYSNENKFAGTLRRVEVLLR